MLNFIRLPLNLDNLQERAMRNTNRPLIKNLINKLKNSFKISHKLVKIKLKRKNYNWKDSTNPSLSLDRNINLIKIQNKANNQKS